MKILKHGNLKQRRFRCSRCECEFVANASEYSLIKADGKILWYNAICPECNFETTDSFPWEDEDD